MDMNEIIEMVNNISVKHTAKIKKLCEPLKTYFGVNHFFMSKTFANGHFFSIGSNLKMHEYYYIERKFACSPFHRNPSYISSGFYAYRQYKEKTFQNSIDDVQQKIGTEPVAGISYKEENALTRFGYCTSPSTGADNVLILLQQNLPLLYAFNTHFMKEMDRIIDDAMNYSIYLPAEIGSWYNTPLNQQTSNVLDLKHRLSFLKEIGVISDFDSLTKRELEYLQHLAKGWTYAQIAKYMKLSNRTVENSVLNLRGKLNCHSKTELIEIAKLF